MFTLTDLFLLKLDKATENIAHYLLPPSTPGFTFVVNIIVPGDDKRGHTHLVVFWNDTRYVRRCHSTRCIPTLKYVDGS
jgi:hypothetical protein